MMASENQPDEGRQSQDQGRRRRHRLAARRRWAHHLRRKGQIGLEQRLDPVLVREQSVERVPSLDPLSAVKGTLS
jgi:hypothetical protein